jgi:undecaprenol kinase
MTSHHAPKLIKTNKFQAAFDGLRFGLKHDRSLQTQWSLAALALVVGLALPLDLLAFLIWLMCIALVLAFEHINSSLESLIDVYHPQSHPKIKASKDLAAASVLIVSILSLFVAALLALNSLGWL